MSKFIVVPALLSDDDGKMIILSDYTYWAQQEDELRAWCNENHAQFAGMTVTLTASALTAFCLKWT